jgi:beta-galactosidase
VTVSGPEFSVAFDVQTGLLQSLRQGKTELLRQPLLPHFWRAPTDNDRGRKMDKSQGIWREALEGIAWEKPRVEELGGQNAVVVVAKANLPKVDAQWSTRYTVLGSGDILVDNQFLPKPRKKPLPSLVRLGMQMELAPGLEQIRWFGPGPQETYSDRKDARISVYSGTVSEQFCADYSEPGESGNKVDVRWVALSATSGTGLLAVGLPHLSVNALHYTTDDLQNAKHAWELPRRDGITLNLDLKQIGVGGDNSWGAWPHDEFMIPCREYRYSFRLRPFSTGDQDPRVLARQTLKIE